MTEDYFSHAFGAEWKSVVEYLQKIDARLDYAYLAGLKSADPEKGRRYAPEYAQRCAEIPAIAAAFKPVVERNLRQRYRASAVCWQVLRYHLEYVCGLADVVIPLATGDVEQARRAKEKLVDAFSRHEIYIERNYDHYLASNVLNEILD